MITNPYFLSIIVAFIVSTLVKEFAAMYHDHHLELHKGFSNGGMPSTHTALITSITAALFFNRGIDELFFLSFVLLLIICSDAIKVRYNLGLQAEKLNKLLKKDERIHVVRGHKLSQVIVGFIIGVLSAFLIHLFFGI